MESKRDAIERYQQDVFEHCLGVGFPFLHAVIPAVLTKEEAAKARRQVYKALRERFPQRFPKGHRFNG